MGDGTQAGAHRRIRAAYVSVVIDGRIAFKYDPYRRLVEWQHRGVKHVVDLAQIEDAEHDAQGDGKAQDGA